MGMRPIALLGTVMIIAAAACPLAAAPPAKKSSNVEIWRFDQTASVGGHPAQVLGRPLVIDTPLGKAAHFNGVNDALFVNVHPLAGARTWTWSVVFHPDLGGAPAQRFFHLAEVDPATGKNTGNRMLFEIRTMHGQWCLDSFAMDGAESRALLNCSKLHPLGRWYRVTAVYDGTMLKNYVGNELQGEGAVHLEPQGPAHSSIGVRINLQDYFKGAILEARFTPAP